MPGLRATCDRLGIIWLEREQLLIDGVRFVGTTLWADYDALARGSRPGARAAAARQGLRAANFYLEKMATMRGGALFDAAAMREQALLCQQWLEQALAQPHDGPTVVVTISRPACAAPIRATVRTPGTAGFCNALDGWLEQADLWLHGHLHCAHDYRAGSLPRRRQSARLREQERAARFHARSLCLEVGPATSNKNRRMTCMHRPDQSHLLDAGFDVLVLLSSPSVLSLCDRSAWLFLSASDDIVGKRTRFRIGINPDSKPGSDLPRLPPPNGTRGATGTAAQGDRAGGLRDLVDRQHGAVPAAPHSTTRRRSGRAGCGRSDPGRPPACPC